MLNRTALSHQLVFDKLQALASVSEKLAGYPHEISQWENEDRNKAEAGSVRRVVGPEVGFFMKTLSK